jgi:hypothetical protein
MHAQVASRLMCKLTASHQHSSYESRLSPTQLRNPPTKAWMWQRLRLRKESSTRNNRETLSQRRGCGNGCAYIATPRVLDNANPKIDCNRRKERMSLRSTLFRRVPVFVVAFCFWGLSCVLSLLISSRFSMGYSRFCFLLGSYFFPVLFRRRPYRVECTGSLLTSEVKRHRARLVLGWGTAWEHPRVLSAFCVCLLVANATMFSGAHACPTR